MCSCPDWHGCLMRPSIIGEEGISFFREINFHENFREIELYIVFLFSLLQEYNPINSVRVPNNSSISGWERDMLYVC